MTPEQQAAIRMRIDMTRDHAQALEDIIAEAREQYADGDPVALAAYLRDVIDDLNETRARIAAAPPREKEDE